MSVFIKWVEKIFKIRVCKKCGSWNLRSGYYASGWNNWCGQASGHRGVMCEDCIHIEFDDSLEERRKKAPNWVDVQR